MMKDGLNTHSIVTGTMGGTLLSIYTALNTEDVLTTIWMGSLGAVVSFVITRFLQWVLKKCEEIFGEW